jgi:hypothetical protein
LLAALGREEPGTDAEYVRAFTGAVLLADGLQELKTIRKLLTAPKE